MNRLYEIIICILFLYALGSNELLATHNRAGEITYRHISGYTYEITITTYTYKPSQANRKELWVEWGDGSAEWVLRVDTLSLPNDYLYNTYITKHTFPGAGIYQILMEDPNRNLGVKNIPNSVSTIFSIKTTMLVSPFTGSNNTPILLNPPIDKAAKDHVFIHNPAAYDPDGDSLSYELTVCTAEKGRQIDGYSYPPASDTFYIDSYTGDLTWINPVDTGVYNVAIYVDEWRDGVRIGRIARDMQIDVYETDNNPPENSPISDLCIEAGETLEFEFTVSDPDNDPIKVSMLGAPLFDSLANYEILESSPGFTRGRFYWHTNCSHAQKQPYTIILKSQDIVSNDISLVDISSFKIRVLHNAPKNLKASPGTDTIQLSWDASKCGLPTGYLIYRKINSSGFIPDSCEVGVPTYTGYELLDVVKGRDNIRYTDDNKGSGLVPGFDYCYMVTAYYEDGAESFASNETCTTLIPGLPPILQVSVENDGENDGQILVSWAMPRDIDSVPGPYRYEIYRQTPNENTLSLISTIPTIDLSDTVYIDSNINTLIYPYVYSVKFLYQEDGEWIVYPGSEQASSLYLDLNGNDNSIEVGFNKRSPWLNYEYHVFRKLSTNTDYDSIGFTRTNTFTDQNLPNNVDFTYKAKSLGIRPLFGADYMFGNKSHINTAQAIDTIAPCAPKTQVTSYCDSAYNFLIWTSPNTLCGETDIVNYQIYYRPRLDAEYQLIGTQNHPDTTFIHNVDLETLAGQYGVAAVDSFNNVSGIEPVIIDSCTMFYLPNVFSPDNDGINDIYYSYNLGNFVQKVDMKIYNRYGVLVYETTDPLISWDGRSKTSNKLVSTGVYYYICTVYEPRLTGEELQFLKGFIHVYSGENNIKAGE